MLHILENTQEFLDIHNNEVIVDCFTNFSGTKKISLAKHAKLSYLIIWEASQIDVQITTAGEWADIRIYGLFFAGSKETSLANISLDIHHDHVQAQVHLISFVQDTRNIRVDGEISVSTWAKKVQAHLLEENVVLGDHIHIQAKPVLNVSSHDVQTSHGAKIEKIDAEKLLYMASRGLSTQQAQALVIQWYLQHIADQLIDANEGQDEKAIRALLDDTGKKVG